MLTNLNLISLDYWHNTFTLRAREVQEWPPGIKRVVARIAWNTAGTLTALLAAAQKIGELALRVFGEKLFSITEGLWTRCLSSPRVEKIKKTIDPAKQAEVKSRIADLSRHAGISSRAALHLAENRPYIDPSSKVKIHGFLSENAARAVLEAKSAKPKDRSEVDEDDFADLDSPIETKEKVDGSLSSYLIYRGLSDRPGYHIMWMDVTRKIRITKIVIDPQASYADITALVQKELQDPKMVLIQPEAGSGDETLTCSDFEAAQILKRETTGTSLVYRDLDGTVKGIQLQEVGKVVAVDKVDDAFKGKCMKEAELERAIKLFSEEKSRRAWERKRKAFDAIPRNKVMEALKNSEEGCYAVLKGVNKDASLYVHWKTREGVQCRSVAGMRVEDLCTENGFQGALQDGDLTLLRKLLKDYPDNEGIMRFMRHSYPCGIQDWVLTFRNAKAAMLWEEYHFACIDTPEMDLLHFCNGSEATELDRILRRAFANTLRDYYSHKENKLVLQLIRYRILQDKFKEDSPLRLLLDEVVRIKEWEIETFESKDNEPRDLDKMMMTAIAKNVSMDDFAKKYLNYAVLHVGEDSESSKSLSESGEVSDDNMEEINYSDAFSLGNSESYNPATPEHVSEGSYTMPSGTSTPSALLKAKTPKSTIRTTTPYRFPTTPRRDNQDLLNLVQGVLRVLELRLGDGGSS